MEDNKFPCGGAIPQDIAMCDREVFERVWRRVMPEDRQDCPIRMDGPVPPIPDLPEPPANDMPKATPRYPATGETSDLPAIRRPVPSAVEQEQCYLENDVPCLGAASAIYGTLLQEFTDRELAGFRYYQIISKRAQGNGGKVIAGMAADKRRHAKRLSTAYFLISGVRYWPMERNAPMSIGTYQGALRHRFCEEQKGATAYLVAAAETTDPCLRELYVELAGDAEAHAWLLRGLLEQL